MVTLRNERLTLTISTLGAEMQSLRDAKGTEFLWQGDPAYWAGRAPILFPMAGGLREDRYLLGGQSYPMPKHGYVRKLEWALESAGETKAVFLMTEKTEGFPFDYELRARYTLEGSAVRVTYSVRNTGDTAFVFGLGAHEGYATPGGIEAYELVFDEEETFANHELHGNLIDPSPVVLGEGTRRFALKYSYFDVDALVFRSLKSRGVTLVSRSGDRSVRVAYPDHDVLMLWTRPGAEYLCIEPWINAPDFLDSDMQIEHKPGCIRLEPGETTERTHIITVS